MSDTPKETPKAEPVPGKDNTPRRGGRENPTVTPRALGSASAPVPPAAPVPPGGAAPKAPSPNAAPGAASAAPGQGSAASAATPGAPAPGSAPAQPTAASQGTSAAPSATGQKPRPEGAPAMPPPPRPATPPPFQKPPAPPAPAATKPAAQPERRDRLALPIAAASGVLALVSLGIALGNRPDKPLIDPARVEALEQRQAALQPLPGQVQALQSGPLAEAGQRIGTLENALREREAAQAQRAAATEQALNAFRAQLDSQRSDREAVQRAADARIEQAERTFGERISGAEAQIAQRIAAAEAALNPRFSAVETAMQQRIAAAEEAARQRMTERDRTLDARFAALEQRETRLAAAERRLSQLIGTTAAAGALEGGRPLGPALANLPGEAPAALRRYADTAPPTEAGLRLSFEDAAREARNKAQPVNEGQSVWESAANRLGNLVTVRRGENVVWGDSVSGELEAARRSLEAGDLAAAVRRVEGLPEPVRAPMNGWLDQARGLLDARRALDELRAGGQG